MSKQEQPQYDLNEKFYIFDNFITSNKHILERGDEEWDSSKIFFQLSVEHADNSPLTHEAESFEEDGKVDWDYIRDINRDEEMYISPLEKLIDLEHKNILQLKNKNLIIICFDEINLLDSNTTEIIVSKKIDLRNPSSMLISNDNTLLYNSCSEKDKSSSTIYIVENSSLEIKNRFEFQEKIVDIIKYDEYNILVSFDNGNILKLNIYDKKIKDIYYKDNKTDKMLEFSSSLNLLVIYSKTYFEIIDMNSLESKFDFFKEEAYISGIEIFDNFIYISQLDKSLDLVISFKDFSYLSLTENIRMELYKRTHLVLKNKNIVSTTADSLYITDEKRKKIVTSFFIPYRVQKISAFELDDYRIITSNRKKVYVWNLNHTKYCNVNRDRVQRMKYTEMKNFSIFYGRGIKILDKKSNTIIKSLDIKSYFIKKIDDKLLIFTKGEILNYSLDFKFINSIKLNIDSTYEFYHLTYNFIAFYSTKEKTVKYFSLFDLDKIISIKIPQIESLSDLTILKNGYILVLFNHRKNILIFDKNKLVKEIKIDGRVINKILDTDNFLIINKIKSGEKSIISIEKATFEKNNEKSINGNLELTLSEDKIIVHNPLTTKFYLLEMNLLDIKEKELTEKELVELLKNENISSVNENMFLLGSHLIYNKEDKNIIETANNKWFGSERINIYTTYKNSFNDTAMIIDNNKLRFLKVINHEK